VSTCAEEASVTDDDALAIPNFGGGRRQPDVRDLRFVPQAARQSATGVNFRLKGIHSPSLTPPHVYSDAFKHNAPHGEPRGVFAKGRAQTR
jgi:hypothetical protein